MKVLWVVSYPFCFLFLFLMFFIVAFVGFCYNATIGAVEEAFHCLKGDSDEPEANEGGFLR